MSDSGNLEQLVELTRELGRPELDYAILGEGNTSAIADEHSFWVKASGANMASIDAGGFVRLNFERVETLLEKNELDDADVKATLAAAKVDPANRLHPSVETLLHAVLLKLDGVHFVGHTHPTVVNILACSNAFPEPFQGRLFPDEVVLCGVAPVLVPYTDPGIPLARTVRRLVEEYLEHYGERPRVLIMQNHGLIALGETAQQVLDVTAMAVKAARILVGTYNVGGPRFLSKRDVDRIHTRPDEQYRRRQLGLA